VRLSLSLLANRWVAASETVKVVACMVMPLKMWMSAMAALPLTTAADVVTNFSN
jgi:hypothetical protein